LVGTTEVPIFLVVDVVCGVVVVDVLAGEPVFIEAVAVNISVTLCEAGVAVGFA